MIPFMDLNLFSRNILCFIYLITCFFFIVNALLSLGQKRVKDAIISSIFFIFSYIILNGIKEMNLKKNEAIFSFFNQIPVFVYVLVVIILFITNIIIIIRNFRWNYKNINQLAYKEAFDMLPAGLCYYKDDGVLILKNHMMNEIAYNITNKLLLNGIEFYDKIKDKSIYELNDMVIKFRFNEFMVDGIHVNEIIADDITELYAKTKELQKLDLETKSANLRMKQYGKNIEENIKRQERLDSKVKIHDEFNKLLLSSLNASKEEDKIKILESFQNNIFVLSNDTENEAAANTLSDISVLAKLIGLEFVFVGNIKNYTVEELVLFVKSTKEKMVNSKKHGNANRIEIRISEDEKNRYIEFINDGNLPSSFVPSGGLKVSEDRVISLNGIVEYNTKDVFKIKITLRKE
jgi:hypothetical protein